MVKKYFAKDIEKISSDKLKSMVGKIKVRKEEGIYEELTGSGLKKYMKDIVRGGKTLSSIERKLKTSGVTMNQASKRQKLMKAIGNKQPTRNQLKQQERAEARKRASLARQARASAELIEGRKDPLHKVFGGQKTETSEHIGVARQTGVASALTSQAVGDDSQASAQAVSVGATIGEATGINPHAQGDDSQPQDQVRPDGDSGAPPSSLGQDHPAGLTSGVGTITPQKSAGTPGGSKPTPGGYRQVSLSRSSLPGNIKNASRQSGKTGSDFGVKPAGQSPGKNDFPGKSRLGGSIGIRPSGTPPPNLPIGRRR